MLRAVRLAWAMQRFELRLLVGGVLLLTVACLAAGMAGDVLTHAAPWVEGTDPGFEDWWSRGPQVAVRGFAVGAIGLSVGAAFGRQLPALLLAGIATVALFVTVTMVMDEWMRDAAEPVAVGPGQLVSGKIYGGGLRDDATGRMLSDEEVDRAFAEREIDEFGFPSGTSMVYRMVPSRRYGEFVLRESAILGGVGALAIGLTALAVSRRRP
jgi:hypothetical protein